VVGLDRIVRVLLYRVHRRRRQLVQDAWIEPSLVGSDLDRHGAKAQRPSEERSCCGQVTLRGQEHVDNVTVLVNRPVEIRPVAGDLDVGLVDEPPVRGSVPSGAGCLNELDSEPLHPPVHAHMIDRDTTFGEQLLDIAVGQPVAQVPADCDRDDSRGNRKPANTEPRADIDIGSVTRYRRSRNATVPSAAIRRRQVLGGLVNEYHRVA
jgi:hypothetical protein